MTTLIYKPSDAGKEFLNKRGRRTRIRKYHLTDQEKVQYSSRWHLSIKDVPLHIQTRASPKFFNPYRQGIYYYQIQTLYLLGSNSWHSLPDIVTKLKEYMSTINIETKNKELDVSTAWDQFKYKRGRLYARTNKDHLGRIQENYIMLQRLSGLNPYGYKLYQSFGALDIKRVSAPGFDQGLYYYRLSTFTEQSESLPLKDFREFIFPTSECKYISKRFLGTIVTKERTIIKGKVFQNDQ